MTKNTKNQSTAHAIMRDPATVMDLNRLGSLYPYKLSFMRKLVRRVMHENWDISTALFNLDKEGYGDVVPALNQPDLWVHVCDVEQRVVLVSVCAVEVAHTTDQRPRHRHPEKTLEGTRWTFAYNFLCTNPFSHHNSPAKEADWRLVLPKLAPIEGHSCPTTHKAMARR